jgi:hypothetical protein
MEASLGAKTGTIWFFDDGILWGEAKPCEFWAVEDLLSKSKGEPLRVISATGRMCSVTLTRKAEKRAPGEEEDSGDEEDDIGEETQFAMIDAREQEGISRWVRQRHDLFGRDPNSTESTTQVASVDGSNESDKKRKGARSAGPQTILQMGDESDESDQDFRAESDNESEGSKSDSSSSDGDGEGEADPESEEGSEADGSGDEEGLDEKRHPLMRPGAMPRMSRAAMDMVVGIVEDDMMGAAGGSDDEMDEDQLED